MSVTPECLRLPTGSVEASGSAPKAKEQEFSDLILLRARIFLFPRGPASFLVTSARE